MSSAWISVILITFLSSVLFPWIACDDLRFNDDGQASLVHQLATKDRLYVRSLFPWLTRTLERPKKKEDSAVGNNLMHSVNLLDRIMKWERASRKFERMRSGSDFQHMEDFY
ncbi:hypothetical protein M514_13442 [Trichuris suis]|uniref:Uncharacterized protein n=1 Tax=Trichuris suis TaxID=68888 RepID=A0A085NSN0_9BILA|nr:hypothetical protein M513_13442 [Trichuris suis]KFD72476.1 hypothetical protein M514_13442 [Trichuris suis]